MAFSPFFKNILVISKLNTEQIIQLNFDLFSKFKYLENGFFNIKKSIKNVLKIKPSKKEVFNGRSAEKLRSCITVDQLN